jgi:hypothetical protein
MSKPKLGDLYSLKNHPYEKNITDIKIASLAQMIPPILVIAEILNTPKNHDTETGNEKPRQVRCVFYSHKSHKFEYVWIDVNQIKPIFEDVNNESSSSSNDEILTNVEDTMILGIKYEKNKSIRELKNDFLNKQVILKSCDLELGKMKTTFSKTDNKSSNKQNSHLDFLPPVLTVIDVRVNDEKITFNPKTGNQSKITSNFLLKCKWFNPLSNNFSEEFIPIETVKLISNDNSIEIFSKMINENKLIKHNLSLNIELEGGQVLEHTYIQPIELIYSHYKYELSYYDFFRSKIITEDITKIEINSENISLLDLIIEKIPEYNTIDKEFTSVKNFIFEKDKYYKIIYKDLQEKISKRVIFSKEFISNKVLIADCLLRNGEERHFRIDGILKIEVLDSKFF